MSNFDYFVILAEMRTGSNFLESNINQFSGLKCYGEAFNPSFIQGEGRQELLGWTLARRDGDPLGFIRHLRENTQGLAGFRLFHNHDPRVFEAVMADPRCAKIILTRSTIESWVSMRIAWSTDQWWLDDAKNAKKWKVKFDQKDFHDFYYKVKGRQQDIARGLQVTGQTGYYIDYEDIQDLDVINGLAAFLGVEDRLEKFAGKFKKQNPEQLADKVRNFDLLEETVNAIDRYDMGRLPNFEPKCGPAVPSWFTAPAAPVLFMPVSSGPVEPIRTWLGAVDGAGGDAVAENFTQKTLRQWKRRHTGHRSFTVLRHPVARLHRAFCRHILMLSDATFVEIRRALGEAYGIALPDDPMSPAFDRRAHRDAFIGFADFVKGNLAAQTSIRVDRAWATQTAVIQGFCQFVLPDHILREDELEAGLARLSEEVGVTAPPIPAPEPEEGPHALAEIYDADVEAAVRGAYQRDYMSFGFGPWR